MKKIGLIRQVLVVGVLLFFDWSLAVNEVKTKEGAKSDKEAQNEFISIKKFGESLFLRHREDSGKDQLFYMDLDTAQGSVPNLKFYPDKEFKTKPIAELSEKGFALHGKLVCQWIKILDGENNKTRVMHIAGAINMPCVDVGVVRSFLDTMGGGVALLIEVDNTTPEYYEIVYNKEKFYINPKNIKLATYDSRKNNWGDTYKAWRFIEASSKIFKREVEKNKKEFKDLLAKDPTLVKFLDDKSKCIKKKDFKCLFGKRGEEAIEVWLAYIYPAIGSPGSCTQAERGRSCYPLPKFEGSNVVDLFWKHVSNCHLDNIRYPTRVSSDYVGVTSAGNTGLVEDFSAGCLLKKTKDSNWNWQIEVNIEDTYTDD